MELQILSGENLPFCPGCGHGPSVKYVSKALMTCGYKPLDVILVSDIGCSGLVDPLFNTHTVHGLHGRSPALALGVVMGLNDPLKKVVTIQGDGGATIGLQHLLEAARRNVNMTLILLNNLIYGMTGGQVSGLSTNEFKVDNNILDDAPPFDVCQLAHIAGAGYVCRVNDPKKITDKLTQALKTEGFSLVEVSSLCQPYGAKKLDQLQQWSRPEVELFNLRQPAKIMINETKSLINENQVLKKAFNSAIKGKLGIMIAGSAGGGVQSAAVLLANAGILSGLSTTMKGEYPITVGTGFSVAEVILSKSEINYTGLEKPNVIIIVSNDGRAKIASRINPKAKIYMDKSVENPDNLAAEVVDFAKVAGKKGSVLAAIAHWIEDSGSLELAALIMAAKKHKHGDKFIDIIESSTHLAYS